MYCTYTVCAIYLQLLQYNQYPADTATNNAEQLVTLYTVDTIINPAETVNYKAWLSRYRQK